MKGIILKDSIRLFGFKSGLGFWFRWSFIDPIEMFYWLNISHKPYCTYSGFYCKNENCEYKHLLTKKEIKKHWAKMHKEMDTVEKGKKGKCVYCGENKGEIEIDNPNPDKINRWLVCIDCCNVIENQQKLCFSQIIGDTKGIEEAQNKLLEIIDRRKDKAFGIMMNAGEGFGGFRKEEYSINGLTKRRLDKNKIKYKIISGVRRKKNEQIK